MSEVAEPSGRNHSQPWTSTEVAFVRDNANMGASVIGLALGRTTASVKALANRNRISLRSTGERRGTLLGQPRGVRWLEQGDGGGMRLGRIRSDVLDGEVSMTDLEARVREIALGSSKPDCPACGARPQQRESTGLCEVCHLRALAQAHRDSEAVREAKRELWRARQESSRSKRAKASEE
jgi:ribosomal protein L37AE/L43A